MYRKLHSTFVFSVLFTLTAATVFGQENQPTLPEKATLADVVSYALENRPAVHQALIDEEIGEREIASALSGWFPQVSAMGSYNWNIKIPTNVIGGNVIQLGQTHVSAAVLQADQQILNPSLIQASKAARYIRQQNALNTENSRINTVVEVSKAYYDILTSEEQLNIIKENIQRLQRQLNDAKARYETGIVDKTDFKRAQIALSNTLADQKRVSELLTYKYAFLKELIGFPIEHPIDLSFDGASMESQILLDTTQTVNYNQRVEFRQLQTVKQLQELNTQYNRWMYLPSLSAFYNYAWDFRHNRFSSMFDESFPRSVLGLTLNIPIFQGGRRVHEIRRSQLLESRIDWDLVNLRNQINTQYEMALATYRANLNDWRVARENVALSEEVYNTIKLQYDEGIKTYLDLMTAETDLRTAQINYLNALFAVLSGKLEVQRALGTVAIENE
ncbi:Outer membrane protein TolC [Parapedobacter composti]|uniref:Outer membrane protein TolC n=1 Tax=Parapedobacter composti TaxID=623281 RepID=A0A1I1JQM5_9SPHI|nr:TolC family protein [Parapedobacter composti]SFC48838.1 Outer membrane protein TolC [Parapedobacter composti]